MSYVLRYPVPRLGLIGINSFILRKDRLRKSGDNSWSLSLAPVLPLTYWWLAQSHWRTLRSAISSLYGYLILIIYANLNNFLTESLITGHCILNFSRHNWRRKNNLDKKKAVFQEKNESISLRIKHLVFLPTIAESSRRAIINTIGSVLCLKPRVNNRHCSNLMPLFYCYICFCHTFQIEYWVTCLFFGERLIRYFFLSMLSIFPTFEIIIFEIELFQTSQK